ncbi:hypothetical protein [Phocaeicola sp.]|uniref:hypothetical protein n=1 Tax=Phocaeicola sp. TaxID=2773926 RepID=UPI003AB7550B
MKQVDIRTRTVPNRPRSGNYPTGSTVSVGGGGSSSTIINEGGGMDLAEARKHFLSRTNDDTAAGIINFSKGLRILSDLINKLFKENTEGDMSDESIMTSLRVLKEIADNNDKLKELFLRKDQEDTTNYLINLLGGVIAPFIQSPDFVSGMMGTGFTLKRNADGTTYAEIDRLLVRMKAIFQVLEIMRTEVGGATMMFNASGARITVTKVERIDKVPFYYSDGAAKYYSDGARAYVQPSEHGAVYRCYFLSDDGDTAIKNLFHAGNLARSQSFNIKEGVHEGVSNRFFWRLVTAVGDDYIDLSVSHCAEGSDVPQEGDVICQIGDIKDPDYQSAIVMSAFGDGAPYITFYQGINSYSLSGKDVFAIGYDRAKQECFIRGYGRMYFGDRGRKTFIEYTKENGLQVKASKFLLESGTDVGGSLSSMSSSISAMQGQISLKVGKDQLKATGIDIDSKTVKVTASQFLVQDSGGTGIAVFKLVNGKPMLKAENIDVENLKVKHLDGADGTFSGELKAATGTFSGELKAATGTFSGTISANGAKVGGFTLDNGALNWKSKDYFGGDSRSIRIGVSTNANTGVVDISFNGATLGKYGVKVVGSNVGGACIYASRNGNSTPNLNNTYAGYFDGGVHVNGNLYSNLIMANTIGTGWTMDKDGIYTYKKGITKNIYWDIKDGNWTKSYKLQIVNGIIIGD